MEKLHFLMLINTLWTNMNIIEHAMNNYASIKINQEIMKYFKKYITYNLMLANSYCIY